MPNQPPQQGAPPIGPGNPPTNPPPTPADEPVTKREIEVPAV